MEKRVHVSGYHIDWSNRTHNSNKQELVSNDNEKQTEKNQIGTVEQSENEINTIDNSPTVTDDNIITSVDNQQLTQPNTTLNDTVYDLLPTIINKPPAEEKQTKPSFKAEFKKGAKMILANGGEPRINGMALTGFILSLVGLFIFGFIFGVLAIIFSAIGLAKIKKDPAKWKGKGMAIAGLVIGIVAILAWLIILALIL